MKALLCGLSFTIFFIISPQIAVAKITGIHFSQLSKQQKTIWQTLLFQRHSFFKATNQEFYLTNINSTSLLEEEFRAISQRIATGLNTKNLKAFEKLCEFPARYFFVAKTAFNLHLGGDFFSACGLPIPSTKAPLTLYLANVIGGVDSGDSLSHDAFVIQGKRHSDGTGLELIIDLSVNIDRSLPRPLRLLSSFINTSTATVNKDIAYLNTSSFARNRPINVHQINLNNNEIYFLSLLSFESKNAKFPYSLWLANCNSYLIELIRVLKPEINKHLKRGLFDYAPDMLNALKKIEPTLVKHYFTSISGEQLLYQLTTNLNWNEFRIVKNMHTTGQLSEVEFDTASHDLRIALGAAAALHFKKEGTITPQAMELRDYFLLHKAFKATARNTQTEQQTTSWRQIPNFVSPTPSKISFTTTTSQDINYNKLNLRLYDTLASKNEGIRPFGFHGLDFEFTQHDTNLYFSRFTLAEELQAGEGCCNEYLYHKGAYQTSGAGIYVLNEPEKKINQLNQVLPSDIELFYSKGVAINEISGWQAKVALDVHLHTYGKAVSTYIKPAVEWSHQNLTISFEYRKGLNSPTQTRYNHKLRTQLEYRLSTRSSLTIFSRKDGFSQHEGGLRLDYNF